MHLTGLFFCLLKIIGIYQSQAAVLDAQLDIDRWDKKIEIVLQERELCEHNLVGKKLDFDQIDVPQTTPSFKPSSFELTLPPGKASAPPRVAKLGDEMGKIKLGALDAVILSAIAVPGSEGAVLEFRAGYEAKEVNGLSSTLRKHTVFVRTIPVTGSLQEIISCRQLTNCQQGSTDYVSTIPSMAGIQNDTKMSPGISTDQKNWFKMTHCAMYVGGFRSYNSGGFAGQQELSRGAVRIGDYTCVINDAAHGYNAGNSSPAPFNLAFDSYQDTWYIDITCDGYNYKKAWKSGHSPFNSTIRNWSNAPYKANSHVVGYTPPEL